MARIYTPVKSAIWQDDDWRDLTPAAQHLYLVLLTKPGLSFAGVGDWRPRRFLPLARGWGMAEFEAAADDLRQAGLIVVDEETEEYLVRSFLRHDGVMQHNKTCISAMNAFSDVSSNVIRGVVVHELKRLQSEFPEWPAWQRDQVREVLKRRAVDPSSAAPLAPGVAANPAPDVAPEVDQDLDPDLGSSNRRSGGGSGNSATEARGVAGMLESAGLPPWMEEDFLQALKDKGATSTSAVVIALHRKGELAARVQEWQTERDRAAKAPKVLTANITKAKRGADGAPVTELCGHDFEVGRCPTCRAEEAAAS